MFLMGKRLKECRIACGLSQEQLIEAVMKLPDNRGKNVVKSKFLTWKMERAQYLWNTHHCLRKSSMFVLSIFF